MPPKQMGLNAGMLLRKLCASVWSVWAGILKVPSDPGLVTNLSCCGFISKLPPLLQGENNHINIFAVFFFARQRLHLITLLSFSILYNSIVFLTVRTVEKNSERKLKYLFDWIYWKAGMVGLDKFNQRLSAWPWKCQYPLSYLGICWYILRITYFAGLFVGSRSTGEEAY